MYSFCQRNINNDEIIAYSRHTDNTQIQLKTKILDGSP